MCVLSRCNILCTVYEFIFPYHIVVFQNLYTVGLNFFGCTVLTVPCIFTHVWILITSTIHRMRNKTNIPENSWPHPHLSPWHPLICFIFPGVLHFPECPVNGITHLCYVFQLAYLGFYVRVVQLFVPFYCWVVCCCHDVLYWPIEGQLGSFQNWAIMRNVAVNIRLQCLYARKLSFL